MSKSLGNIINPIEYSTKYSKELLILYILSAFSIWKDVDYDKKDAILTYNAKLANNFWNLLNRAVVLCLKLRDENLEKQGIVGEWFESFWGELKWKLEDYLNKFEKAFENSDLKTALDTTFAFLDEVNLYVTQKEPWNTLKDNSKLNETKKVLYTICENIRQVSMNLYPFFPEKMWEVFHALNLNNYVNLLENWKLKDLRTKKEVFDIKEKAPILFQKFEIE
jgi:methionyl-tRNA synthetase